MLDLSSTRCWSVPSWTNSLIELTNYFASRLSVAKYSRLTPSSDISSGCVPSDSGHGLEYTCATADFNFSGMGCARLRVREYSWQNIGAAQNSTQRRSVMVSCQTRVLAGLLQTQFIALSGQAVRRNGRSDYYFDLNPFVACR